MPSPAVTYFLSLLTEWLIAIIKTYNEDEIIFINSLQKRLIKINRVIQKNRQGYAFSYHKIQKCFSLNPTSEERVG